VAYLVTGSPTISKSKASGTSNKWGSNSLGVPGETPQLHICLAIQAKTSWYSRYLCLHNFIRSKLFSISRCTLRMILQRKIILSRCQGDSTLLTNPRPLNLDRSNTRSNYIDNLKITLIAIIMWSPVHSKDCKRRTRMMILKIMIMKTIRIIFNNVSVGT
jgi:hypothetical protein